jgi:hypothetical protein
MKKPAEWRALIETKKPAEWRAFSFQRIDSAQAGCIA